MKCDITLSKALKNSAKRYLPDTFVSKAQQTIRLWRRTKLRLERTISPENFCDDPFSETTISYVRPEDIKYWGRDAASAFCVNRNLGRILDGNWDLDPKAVTETSFYTSYEMRLNCGISWRETPYYRQVAERIKKGEVMWNCSNAKEFENKCEQWDRIFTSIRDEGYIADGGLDEISVNIDRHGRLQLNDGYHRLVFCKLLRVPEIPVIVAVRHRKWHEFRRELYEFAQSGRHSRKGTVYAPLLHPDLQTVPSQHGHDRFGIIKKHVRGKRILDIGAYLGYFCHRFEELGHECVAVESHADICYFLRKLHRAQERQFRIVEESIFPFVEREKPVFDTVLALSIFHHFIKEEYLYLQLVRMLSTLKAREIIFEPHSACEGQMRGAYRNFDSKEFVDFILEHSGLRNSQKIGVAKDGREIYRLF